MMKQRFRLFRRTGGVYYLHDSSSNRQHSLHTRDRTEARRLIHARNEAEQHPALNFQLARTYLLAGDPAMTTRTWQHVMEEAAATKSGANRLRWERAMRQRVFDQLRHRVVIETRAEQMLKVLREGTVSTNTFLRRLHNYALDLNWLPVGLIPRQRWPKLEFRPKRAVTLEEHGRIVAAERNPERRAFYELCWHLGGSQSDVAGLTAEHIDWKSGMISFQRMKTDSPVHLRFGETAAATLRQSPVVGPLFPRIGRERESDRAKAFSRRCRLLKIEGISLHSYRYSWAERARRCGYPERFAQIALGHKSQAVHHAYARKAQVRLPALDTYEQAAEHANVISLGLQQGDVSAESGAGTREQMPGVCR